MEDSAVLSGFENLKDGHDFDDLYHSALCRAQADWLIGINATRLYSTLYSKTLSVGRVQSPTLAMITKREEVISGFVKEKFYHVSLDMGSGTCATSEHITSVKDAKEIKEKTNGQSAICSLVASAQKTLSPPKLFDLTALQREANKLFSMTAKQTLDTAQTLYEKKLLTYPRTDSRYLTSDMETSIPALVRSTAELTRVEAASINAAQVVNDAKVSDHHAIIPTASVENSDVSTLSEAERNILLLVALRLVCAVSDEHVFEAVTATFECGGTTFTAKGKTVISEGFKQAEAHFKNMLKVKTESDSEDAESIKALPAIVKGQIFDSVSSAVSEHYTTPPKPYTEDTLLSAMENAGAKDTNDDAERKGLGTPATRAAVIENLIARGFLERKGKQLLATTDGETLIKVLPDVLKTPALTAEWENTLTLIAKGKASATDFMDGIRKLTEAMVESSAKDESLALLFTTDKEVIGVCPRCGKSVFEGKKNFYCESRECNFTMWRNDRFFESKKKELTKQIAAALLKDGKASIKGLYSEKTGKTYDATVVLADTGDKYVNYRFEKRQ
jgi:DNA topoisomerase-3